MSNILDTTRGASLSWGNSATSNPEADRDTYLAAKRGQIAQYEAKAKWYRRRTRLYSLAVFALIATAAISFFLGAEALSAAAHIVGIVLAALCLISIFPLIRLRRNDLKSAILLNQFAAELNRVLAASHRHFRVLKADILRIETNFLNNDDELYTKKYIWQSYLDYLHDKAAYYANYHFNKNNPNVIEPHPAHYVSKMPAVWMQENPFNLDNNDRDFVYKNWQIKRKIRRLYFAHYRTKYQVLNEVTAIAQGDPIVFERMLRHKKISKGLKVFKRQAWIRYLTPAAKMKLVTFVDSVLAERPYVDQCDAMQQLISSKNAQIMMYTDQFWRVHRRSLKFYALEFICGLLIIPLIIGSIAAGVRFGFLAGSAIFVLGGAAIVFGEMAIVTTQLRDMKAKKLTPSLVSSLIAIRHNICADSVLDDAQVYQHERAFKAAEKRFILTVTEAEPVKAAKENVSDKVLAKLEPQMIQLRANKEAQAQVYYEKFNYYRRQCLKYGALEALVGLLMVPAVLFIVLAYTVTITIGFEFVIAGAIVVVGLVMEIVSLRRHIVVARRKELYLLIYQKMAVLLSDYRLFNHPRYIAAELTSLEDSVRRAAALDNIIDVDEHIGDISAVDLGAFDDTMWDRIAIMQPTPNGAAPKPDATLQELVP